MGKHPSQPTLTPEEQHLLARLRQSPQSVEELAAVLRESRDAIHVLIESLDRKVGLIPLFRSGTLRYGLAE